MNSSGIVSIISILLTALSSAVIGMWIQTLRDQHEKKQERYDHLYAPFVKLLLKETHGAFCFTDLPETLQQEFISILFSNYEYSDIDLQELIYLFKSAYDYHHMNSDDDHVENEINQYFFNIQIDISSTYQILNKSLYYESPGLKRKKKRIAKQK